jgi:acetyl esterase
MDNGGHDRGDDRRARVFPGMELTADARRAVSVEEMVATTATRRSVRVLVYRPRRAPDQLPLVLRMHGGGFTRFAADSFAAMDAAIARLGATVVSVDYRLAPVHPFPAAPDDCSTALCWAYETLSIDRSRVVVTGSSAGGALAAAVALMARDRGGPLITHQLLHVPMLDDRLLTPSMRRGHAARDGMTHAAVANMWSAYLPADVDRRSTPAYAAPGRAFDLGGLPATFVQVNELDPLRDEGLAFALRLQGAGVPVTVHCASGLDHGAMSHESPRAQEAQQIFDAAMKRALVEIPGG